MHRGIVVVALVGSLACGDIVIGTFPLGAAGGTSAGTAGSDDGSSSTGALPLPGGCVDETFDASTDALWSTWADADASITPGSGVLTLVPPTAPELGTGFVLHTDYAFDFSAGRVQVEVITPPDPTTESELFLQVVQAVPYTSALLSMGLYKNTVRVTSGTDDGAPMMAGPVATAYPRWIGIRTEASTAYFESSDDGVAWTTLSSVEQPAAFPGVTPLVMVWNNMSDAAVVQQPVVVDNFSVCAD